MSNLDEPDSSRLDAIVTRWSLLQRAHAGSMMTGNNARSELVQRYFRAIQRYIAALLKHDDDSDELAQEVVIRLLQGDFAGADPNRGRFRDLLKVAVRNMVRNHWEKSNRRKAADYELELVEDAHEQIEHDPWLQSWRDNLLDNAWARLAAFEQDNDGSYPATVLRMRANHPDENSQQLAQRVSDQLQKNVRPDSLRQQLRRARLRFAEYLVEEIVQGLEDPTRDRVQDELVSLGLYEQIKDVLPEEWKTSNH